MTVYNTAHRLAKEIKESDEYQNYQKMREKILVDESAKKMLKDYVDEQMKLQAKKRSGQELTQEEQEKIEELQNLVDLNANVKQYLQAEYQMSVMLNDLQEILFGDLEIGVVNEEESDNEANE